MSIYDALKSEESAVRRVYGVVAAKVTNNRDPQGLGRVKLWFPWLSEQNETDWVRMATLMAGPGRGSFFLPEAGDEVLVAFEHGDLNYPFVLGMLWNGQDHPPEPNHDGKNNLRVFRSRSGHELVFNDDGGRKQEKIVLHTRGGHQIILDDSDGQEQIAIVDRTGNNQITINSVNDAITIECKGELNLSANRVKINALTTLELHANALLTLKGVPIAIN